MKKTSILVLLPRRKFREATEKEITFMETKILTLSLPKGEGILEKPQMGWKSINRGGEILTPKFHGVEKKF